MDMASHRHCQFGPALSEGIVGTDLVWLDTNEIVQGCFGGERLGHAAGIIATPL
jgi:hypothetical protein